MPRRRLYGETQKRRRKPRTRLLKRANTPVRVQATQQPAPFEQSPRIEREDLEFLEAMRELDVQRMPGRGESVARRQAVERVQFLADDGEDALFQCSMARQGVTPLDGAQAPAVAEPSAAADPSPAPAPLPAADPESAPAPAAGTEPAPAVHPANGNGAAAPGDAGPAASAPPTAEAMEIDDAGEDARALMEALLREEAFEPGLKFAGAAAPPRRAKARPPWEEEEAEPDDELDLHGKTQEEAIHMVQNFLLVSQRKGLHHVLIITGRGRNSGEHGPVLKESVRRWLELNGKRFVRAFAAAPPRWGGEGALWVTLRRQR